MNDSMVTSGKLTPKADTNGIVVKICDPGWFQKNATFRINNAPPRTANLEFSGADLNFLARVLYAESSGSAQLKSKDERAKEKEAMLNVKHFRLNRLGYPNRSKAMTFTAVCEAPNQFESVYAASPKFSGSAANKYESLNNLECQDLAEAIEAIRSFIESGPNKDLVFDNFRGGKGSRGETIGLSRFWLSSLGEKLYEQDE